MEYLRVKNWEKWQSYRKDRGQPPWIKVHRRILRNLEWVSMSDAERGQLVAIWVLAADHDGVIPASPEIVQKLCFMSKQPNLNKFIELGLLTPNGGHGGCQADATMTPGRRQHDQPKAEAKAETEAKAEAEEKNTCALTSARATETPPLELFEKFYAAYPKKKSKDDALKAFEKRNPSEALLQKMLDALETQKKSHDWIKEGGKYIPYPATWLNRGGWMDQPTEVESAPYSETTAQNLRVLKDWRPT